MLILDTDHVSLLERTNAASLSLQMRLGHVGSAEILTSVITYEEQMRGWLAHSAQATTTDKMLVSYKRLQRHIELFRFIKVMAFNEAAAKEYELLRRARIRIGSMDLKIAAVCLANDATLLTRNAKDFRQVPGLKFEDWSL